MSACHLNITRARFETDVSRHAGKAALHDATADSSSDGVQSGTRESFSCVAGLTMSTCDVAVDATRWLSITIGMAPDSTRWGCVSAQRTSMVEAVRNLTVNGRRHAVAVRATAVRHANNAAPQRQQPQRVHRASGAG